jgi:hypothetical protein
LTLAATVPSANASVPIVQGITGDAPTFSSTLGDPVADHAYAHVSQAKIPVAKMITVGPGVTWRTYANAQPGSSLYNNTVRWADALRDRGGTTLVSFDHEPEANGTSNTADFIAAFRKWVSIFRAEGATNVEQVWQMTAYSFRTNPADRRYAAKWYPGDEYVDIVGADPYNWYGCGPGRNQWVELSTLADPALEWARSRGKQFALPEYASNIDSQDVTRRATWLRNAHAWMVANADSIRAVFYFQQKIRVDCTCKLQYSDELQAYREIAEDPNFTYQ